MVASRDRQLRYAVLYEIGPPTPRTDRAIPPPPRIPANPVTLANVMRVVERINADSRQNYFYLCVGVRVV